jgi:TldD protein
MLEPLLDKNTIEKVLGQMLGCGGDWSELFLEHTENNSILAEDDKLEKISSGTDQGVGLRLVKLPYTYYAATSALSPETLLALAKELAEAAARYSKDICLPTAPPIAAFQTRTPVPAHYKILPGTVPLTQKLEKVLTANTTARGLDKRIRQVTVGYRDTTQNILVADSNGLYVHDRRVRTRLVVNVTAQENAVLQTGYEGPAGLSGFEFFDDNIPEEIATEATERALLMLSAKPAPAGKMQVVLSGEAGGTLIHEACGHAFEADFIFKKTSVFHDKLGQQVLSPLITVIDDGSMTGHFGSGQVDDEGTSCRKNILVENGRIAGFMHDRVNAALLKMNTTGNGRRESFRNRPVPRMTNTYIAPGKHDPQEIIASVKDGLLVRKMGGGQVDITSGDFVFEVTESFLIRNGKIAHPVRGATLVGNGPKILAAVDMVGNDLHFMPGVCGKGDSAPVTDGQPTLRIPEITVGGIV